MPIFPEVQGCDGVFFIDRSIYGSPKKPVVTAKTTVAADATVKVGTTAPVRFPLPSSLRSAHAQT